MSHDTLTLFFWLSLGIGMPAGLALALLWAKKILPGLLRKVDKNTEQTGRLSLMYVALTASLRFIPGLVLLILCCIPALYFNNLLQQEQYCIEVIRVNKGRVTKTSPIIAERCSCLDVEGLFQAAETLGPLP